jgi:hypothetical protein
MAVEGHEEPFKMRRRNGEEGSRVGPEALAPSISERLQDQPGKLVAGEILSTPYITAPRTDQLGIAIGRE